MSSDKLTKMNRHPSNALLIIAIFAVIAGTILRITSFSWNGRLQGDVNLFALTAREFVLHDRLYYPMKFEYSDNVEYKVLKSPASQHPPLWPLTCGLLGKIFQTDATFSTLKIMCEIAGAFLIALVVYVGVCTGWPSEALVTISCVSLSSMLVDFSANGSSYILSGVIMILAAILMEHFRYQRIIDYVLAGILCGISLQIHSMMICIAAAFFVFWLWERSRVRWKGVLSFILAGLLILAPWIFWNLVHFGKPFYSYSVYYFLKQLNLAQQGIYGDVITTRIVRTVSISTVKSYISLVANSARSFSFFYLLEIGPFCSALALVGCFRLFRRDRRKALAFFLPFVLYTIVILLWGSFKYRFLVPILPITYVASAFGLMDLFVELDRRSTFRKLAGWICIIGTIFWGALGFFEQTPTRYYWNDGYHAAYYEKMLPLAKELGQRETGVLLGYSLSLDGGFETIYWHRFPFVYGRGFNRVEELRKLVHDFQVRYIWADEATVHQVESYLPEARIILRNESYYIFEVSK